MDVVDASEERIRGFLQDEVLGNLRPMFPHFEENIIRDIVIRQSMLLNNSHDQINLTNSCVDVLLETRTVQQENSPLPKDYIDLTQFEDSAAALRLRLANRTFDDTPAGNASFIDLITDESSLNSTNEPPGISVSGNSPLSNSPVSEYYPKETDNSNISLERVSCDIQKVPKDGSTITPVSTPVRFEPDILKTTPLGSRNAHPMAASSPLMRSPDNHGNGYVSKNGQHHRAKSSKAPSTMSRCPCDDCKMNPSSHSHHNSSSSHNGDRARHQSTPGEGGHSSPSILASTRASGSISDSELPQSSATSHLGSVSTSASSNSTTAGKTVPTRVTAGTSKAERPADSRSPPAQKSSPEGDLMKARLESLNEAILKLSKMSKTPRSVKPRTGQAKKTSPPVTTTSVPVTSNTTGLSHSGFQRASTLASNPINRQLETARVNTNSNNVSICNKPNTGYVNRTGTLNPGTASTISPTKPGYAGDAKERASCRYATSSSAAGPLPSSPYSGIQRMYKTPSSTSFPNRNPSTSQLRTSSKQPNQSKIQDSCEVEQLKIKEKVSSSVSAVEALESYYRPGIHSSPGQSAFTIPVSTNSQSLSKKPTTVDIQWTTPNRSSVGRLDSEPRTTASSVRLAVPTCQTAAASTSVSLASAPATMGRTFVNPAPLREAETKPPQPLGLAKQPIPTVYLPLATGSDPSLSLNSQQEHYARANPSFSTLMERVFNQPQYKLTVPSQKPALKYIPHHLGPIFQPKPVVPLIMHNQKVTGQRSVQAQPGMMPPLSIGSQPAIVHRIPLAIAHQQQPAVPAQAQPVPTATMPQPPAPAQPAMAHQTQAQVQAQPGMMQQPPIRSQPAMVHRVPLAISHQRQPPVPAQAQPVSTATVPKPSAPAQPAIVHQPPAQAQAPPVHPAMVQQPPAQAQAPPVHPAMVHQPPPRAQAPPVQPAMVHQDPPAMVDQPQIAPALFQLPPEAAFLGDPPFTIHNFDLMAAEVLTMFPDVEPEYVLTKLKEFQDHPSPAHLMCNHLLESANYPKVKKPDVAKTTSPKDKESSDRADYVKDYFKITPKSGHQEVLGHLQCVFTMFSVDSLRQVLNLHFCHYAPTRVCLDEILCTNEKVRHAVKQPKSVSFEQRRVKVEITTKDRHGRAVKTTIPIQILKGRRSIMCGKPQDQELLNQINFYKEYMKNSAVEKDLIFALSMNENEYEAEGQLIECGCCYAEVPFENMVQCLDGHLFCSTCLQSYAQQAVYGQGKALLMCMTDGCDSSYPRVQLEKCLTSKDLVKYDERVQEESIQLADIEGFVKCPSCDFGALLDPGDKVFKCQKSDCMKESCRHCGEDWAEHFGKRCEEVEKKNETNLRLLYEERMSQAQIRTCHGCKMKIMKDQGCNKMTCRCGAKMCYICRKPNIEYTHFCPHARNPGQGCTVCVKCSLWTDPVEEDARAVKELEKELQVEKDKMIQAKKSHELSRPIDLDGPEAKRQRIV